MTPGVADRSLPMWAGLAAASCEHSGHAFCLQPHDGEAREFGTFAHQPDAIDAWARALRQRFGGRIARP